jgi:hypothetical protein
MWQSVQKYGDTRWALTAFALLLLAGIWGLTLWQLDNDEHQARAAQRESRDLVRLFSEHAARTVLAADQAALFLRQRYAAEGRQLKVSDELKSSLGAGRLYHLFSIVDPAGNVVLSSQPFTPTNLADRPHIRIHGPNSPDLLYISAPVLGRVSGKWSLQISRRITMADGRYGGVVVVSLDPLYFTQLYGEVDVGRQGSVALVGADGVVRARRSANRTAWARISAPAPCLAPCCAAAAAASTPVPSMAGRASMALPRCRGCRCMRWWGWTAGAHGQPSRAPAPDAALATLTSAVVLAFTAMLSVLTRRLIRSREAACAANLAKSRFWPMSHELRTPLNGVLGYAELLQGELGDSKQGNFASRIHACGMRLLGLVEAVLELSGLESGHATLDLRQEQVGEMAQRVVSAQRCSRGQRPGGDWTWAARCHAIMCVIAPNCCACWTFCCATRWRSPAPAACGCWCAPPEPAGVPRLRYRAGHTASGARAPVRQFPWPTTAPAAAATPALAWRSPTA